MHYRKKKLSLESLVRYKCLVATVLTRYSQVVAILLKELKHTGDKAARDCIERLQTCRVSTLQGSSRFQARLLRSLSPGEEGVDFQERAIGGFLFWLIGSGYACLGSLCVLSHDESNFSHMHNESHIGIWRQRAHHMPTCSLWGCSLYCCARA